MTRRRTYWHLSELGRKPSDYDVGTSRLLYYPGRGFEVTSPISEWYARYQDTCPLRCRDWDRFRDPRETTYAKYVQQHQEAESFIDGILQSMEETGYDARLTRDWIAVLGRVLAPLRYPLHGLQMVSAYVGNMAPSGRIVTACLFQAADEMRRVQRIAYRMRMLQETHAGFGNDSRALWQEDPIWQPLRQVIEKLLVTYEWAESFVALNLAVKPMLDELFMTHFARLALARGDEALQKIFWSLNSDCLWHREWSGALVRMLIDEDPDNASHLVTWLEPWRARTATAVAALCPVFDGAGDLGGVDVEARIQEGCRTLWASFDLNAYTRA